MKKAESFTDAQKKKVSESLAKYADACVSTLKVAGIASNSALQTTSLITSGQITDINDLKEKMSLTAEAASNLPGFGADLVKMGWSYIDLAKEKGIDTSVAAETLKNAI